MNSYIQLISLVTSFIYGILLYFFNKYNYKLIEKCNIIAKIVISLLYVFNISLIFVCFLYYLNGGILHIYNLLFILVGYSLVAIKKCKE